MKKYFLDTETCGFHGVIVLIQYAIDDGPIVIHDVWKRPAIETLHLIEDIVDNCVIGFNLTFDWFHICKLYTMFVQLEDKTIYPEDHVNMLAELEEKGRDLDICLRPRSCFDLMLHARKGPYQSTMDRKDIRIKRVPTVLADKLARELDARIPLKNIYFARKSDPSVHFQVVDIEEDGEILTDLKDIVLKFQPSSGLKALAADIMGEEKLVTMKEVGIAANYFPEELGYAPFAKAPFMDGGKVFYPGRNGIWYGRWPGVIDKHIEHWNTNSAARQYAYTDIVYTKLIYDTFQITTEQHDDDDSVLACGVAAERWRGYRVDTAAIQGLKELALAKLAHAKIEYNSPQVCKTYMMQVMTPAEQAILTIDGSMTTKGPVLEQVEKWQMTEQCAVCAGVGFVPDSELNIDCSYCKGKGWIELEQKHPAALRAREILDLRRAKKEVELYDKLILADRLHADMNIIGALSGRMSGAGGLNAQGINHSKVVRETFKLAWEDMQLTGGDFAGSQIAIAAAVYNDPQIKKNLMTDTMCFKCEGVGCPDCKGTGKEKMKIYAIFGTYLFPGNDYAAIRRSKGRKGDADLYDRSKKGVLAMLFGGEAYTLSNRVGISEDAAKEGYQRFLDAYPVWAAMRKGYADRFCSMRQPGGIGTKVIWRDPDDSIASMFDFKRFFTLENQICKTIFEIANKPPWKGIEGHIRRRTRDQTMIGAIQSALYASAFALQSACMRAAANHVIQSPEATMVKMLQARIWRQFQPIGIRRWQVMPINIHDEIMNPARPEHVAAIHKLVDDFVQEMRAYVPLMDIEWEDDLKSWAEK